MNPLDDLPDDQVFESSGIDVIEKVIDIREEFDELVKKKKDHKINY